MLVKYETEMWYLWEYVREFPYGRCANSTSDTSREGETDKRQHKTRNNQLLNHLPSDLLVKIILEGSRCGKVLWEESSSCGGFRC